MKTCLKFRNICETDDVPCMISATMVFARDLELPGFPTKKRGIRSSMEITIMNTFSLRALFFAIFLSKLTFSRKTSWHLLKKSIFKGKLEAIKKTYINETANIGSEYVVFIKHKMSFAC